MKKSLSLLLLLVLAVSVATTAHAGSEVLLYDEADLLTAALSEALAEQMQDFHARFDAEIAIVTVPSSNYGDVAYFADSLYDELEIGFGRSNGGVLLVGSMSPRQYHIIVGRELSDAMDADTIEDILDKMYDDMRAGDYDAAFQTFLRQCRYYTDGHLNGFPFPLVSRLLICVGIGLVIGLITVFVLKTQLKSVRREHQANAYIRTDSMHLTVQRDLFLYRQISRTRKQSSSSGSSGGGGRSSGGRSF